MARFTRDEIEEIYHSHPLRKDTILQRVLQQKGTLAGLSEQDLAEDPWTEISDQNHIGGLAFTRELAERAGLGSASRVLDLGCGLGGSARCLAWLFGCHVLGLDISAERIVQARELTELLGLQNLVTFECVDLMTADLPSNRFDVLWGQSAWVHIADKLGFLRKWGPALDPKGCLAFEDVFLMRLSAGKLEEKLVAELENHWKSHLVGLDGPAGWNRILADCGFATTFSQDCSEHLRSHFLKLQLGASRAEALPVNQLEQESWRLALEAVDAGLIGYFRIVAARR
jgi:SAM-dependent methyltransferase